MEMASSTTLQGPSDDNIVRLLHLTVFLCVAMSVMLFVEKVYMAIIILVKLYRKRSGRHPERQYIWDPIREKDEILVQIPVFNEKEVYQLAIGAACRVSWTSDRIIIQVLDDSTDPIIKERNKKEEVMKDENERNQEEEIRTTEEKEDENERNQGEETTEEKEDENKRNQERTTEEKEDENQRNQEEEIRTTEDKEDENQRNQEEEIRKEDENERNQEEEIKTTEEKKGWKRRGDERKSQAKRRKKAEIRTIEDKEDENERNLEEEIKTTEEKKGRKRRGDERKSEEQRRKKAEGRWKRGGDTLGERKSQAKRRKIAEVNQDVEGRKKRKQQCRWSCMAMGCAAIFTSVLIYLCAANIPEEETIYLVAT